ncbi:uncharacterized protein C10orf67 homolog, mitochondrial isoform X1 [Thamnophis elegans]|uniref:uncharacterized protein C10orf67 homolog, mitochondrial isoform X1 n=1 Tax=Thamnophis elegans TaxID=35005 RepID=UPI0013764B59|nr:uncharacterized protein C10orf67 homolog, mitochondrial isoform X1 [Thamnophis elegans]
MIPSPRLFIDVIQNQWASPASAVPEEALRPEDKRIEPTLVHSHQASAWSFRAGTSASFFSRSALLWLRQLQAKLPARDFRARRDINKIKVALEYTADASLDAARFAPKTIASPIPTHRLLWLKQWQAEARAKWRLASFPYSSSLLFGVPLDAVLVESKDKRKVLPLRNKRVAVNPFIAGSPFGVRTGVPPAPVYNVRLPPDRALLFPTGQEETARDSSPESHSGTIPTDPTRGRSDCLEELPIGGRLSTFVDRWDNITNDVWVRSTIRFGLLLDLHSSPPNHFVPCPISRDPQKRLLVEQAMHHLLLIRAIQSVPPGQVGREFYSHLFIVSKSSDGWRAILDLKFLNQFIRYRRFKMHTLLSILESMHKHDLHISGPHGGLPPRTHSQTTQTVPPICLCGPSLSVSGPPLRAVISLKGLHQALVSRSSPLRYQTHSDLLLPGRHPPVGQVTQLGPAGSSEHLAGASGGRILHQSGEKPPCSYLLSSALGSPHRLRSREGLPVSGMTDQPQGLSLQVWRRQQAPLLQLSQLLGKMVSCFSILGRGFTAAASSGFFCHSRRPKAAVP